MGTPRSLAYHRCSRVPHEPQGFEKSLFRHVTDALHVGDHTERHVRVCEGSTLKIDCQGDQKLEITAADFGRSAHGICKGLFDLDWNTNCHARAALEITKRECEGLQSCVLHASVSEYGDPCAFIKKYLTVCNGNCVHVCDLASLLIGSKKKTRLIGIPPLQHKFVYRDCISKLCWFMLQNSFRAFIYAVRTLEKCLYQVEFN